jgi:uncharacterized protein (TIGR02246 family)
LLFAAGALNEGPAALDQRGIPMNQAVQKVAEDFIDAWNRHDMRAFANLYAEDADFVNVYGMHWKGREEIETAHRASHETIFRSSKLSASRIEPRLLGADTATVHVFWDLSGLATPDGPIPDRKGILLHVLVRNGGGWSIVASQNTDIVTPPA